LISSRLSTNPFYILISSFAKMIFLCQFIALLVLSVVCLSSQAPLDDEKCHHHDCKTRTTSSSVTSTSTFAVKTGVPDCDIHGIASPILLALIIGDTNATDVLACQLSCEYTSRCQSWSFRPPVSTLDPAVDHNCVYYGAFIRDSPQYIIRDNSSTTVFSDKYPSDGSNFCFGDPYWGIPGISSTSTVTSILILTTLLPDPTITSGALRSSTTAVLSPQSATQSLPASIATPGKTTSCDVHSCLS